MASGNRRIRVIVADDSKTALRSVCEYLKVDEKFEVVGTATNGCEVLEQTERLRPDLVLTDLHMPRLTGMEAAKSLRTSFPGLRILIFLALRGPSLREECLRCGADGLVEKGQVPEGLMEEVQRLFPGPGERD
jgi:DNA-binding NarL/FixJ family response regulator